MKNLFKSYDYMKDFSIYGIHKYIYWKIFTTVMTIWKIFNILKNLYNGHDYMKDFQCIVFIITYIEKFFQQLWLHKDFQRLWLYGDFWEQGNCEGDR